MSDEKTYSQFPLCTLVNRFGESGLGDAIRFYSVVRTGAIYQNRWGKTFDEVAHGWRDSLGNDFDPCNDIHRSAAVFLAHVDSKLTLPSVEIVEQCFLRADAFHLQFTSRFGPEPYVRVRNDFVDELRGGLFDESEFRVLCGILAVIGRKKRVVISRPRIAYAASGFRSASVYQRWCERPLLDHHYPILSPEQVGRRRKKLEPRGIFHSVFDGRHRHFSIRVGSHDMLSDLVLKSRRPAINRRIDQREAEQKLRRAMSAMNRI